MDSVFTFIGPNMVDSLPDIMTELAAQNCAPGTPQWLKEDEALDIPFSGLACDAVNIRLRVFLDKRRWDGFAQPVKARRKRLLIADMDSTTITTETMDDIAAASPFQKEIMAITQESIDGSIDFSEGLRKRVRLLEGLDRQIFEKVRAAIKISPGADILVNTMKKNGALTVLASGGFTYFADAVGGLLGFDRVHANHLPLIDGKVSAALHEPILDSAAKSEILLDIVAELGLKPDDSAAIGDGSNDIAMLKVAGLGCAYRGKPIVKKAIQCQLNHTDLSGLLYYQGYRHDEFCPPSTGC